MFTCIQQPNQVVAIQVAAGEEVSNGEKPAPPLGYYGLLRLKLTRLQIKPESKSALHNF